MSMSRDLSTRAATPSPLAEQAEEEVLRSNVGMIERLGFLALASASTFFTRGV